MRYTSASPFVFVPDCDCIIASNKSTALTAKLASMGSLFLVPISDKSWDPKLAVWHNSIS